MASLVLQASFTLHGKKVSALVVFEKRLVIGLPVVTDDHFASSNDCRGNKRRGDGFGTDLQQFGHCTQQKIEFSRRSLRRQ